MGPFLDPGYVWSLNLGANWNCCEGPGLPRLGIRVWGTRACFKAYVLWDRKGSIPVTILLYSIIFYSIHSEQLHDLYRAIKSRRTGWVGRVAHMRKRAGMLGLVTEDHFGDLGGVGRKIVKCTVKTYGVNMWIGF